MSRWHKREVQNDAIVDEIPRSSTPSFSTLRSYATTPFQLNVVFGVYTQSMALTQRDPTCIMSLYTYIELLYRGLPPPPWVEGPAVTRVIMFLSSADTEGSVGRNCVT